jgi:molecular chaperone GrpE
MKENNSNADNERIEIDNELTDEEIENMQQEENGKEDEEKTKLKDELGRVNEQYLRLYADFDNYRKRVQKEIQEAQEATKRALINDFLVILDNMEKALSISHDHKDSIIEGIELTVKSFKDMLKKHGVEEIDPQKERFDPDFHDALMTQESNEHPKNTVLQTLEKGYKVNDKLIRPAKVVVSSGNSENE